MIIENKPKAAAPRLKARRPWSFVFSVFRVSRKMKVSAEAKRVNFKARINSRLLRISIKPLALNIKVMAVSPRKRLMVLCLKRFFRLWGWLIKRVSPLRPMRISWRLEG